MQQTTTAPPPPPTSTDKEERPGGRRYLVPALIVGLALSLVLAITVLILYVVGSDTSPGDVRDYLNSKEGAVTSRATTVLNLLLNYDSTNIEQIQQQMLAVSTGDFQKDYQEALPQLGTALEKVSASSRGQILSGPDIYFKGPSEATAIANVTQTVQNTRLPEGRTVEYVVQLSMIETADDGWKADRVEVLSSREG